MYVYVFILPTLQDSLRGSSYVTFLWHSVPGSDAREIFLSSGAHVMELLAFIYKVGSITSTVVTVAVLFSLWDLILY